MRRKLLIGVGLTLSGLVSGANAQETQWRPAASHPTLPAVTLMAPLPGAGTVQQSSFGSDTTSSEGVVRAQINDTSSQPMPPGPKTSSTGPAPKSEPGILIEEGPAPSTLSKSVSGGVASAPFMVQEGAPAATCGDCATGGQHWWSGVWAPDNYSCGECLNGACAPRPMFWVNGEYLLWFVKKAPTPDLVTTNSQGNAPVIGVPGTSTVSSGGEDYNARSGGRFTIGVAVPYVNNLGFEATAFFLANRNAYGDFGSDGSQSIGRPFTNVGPGLSGFPGNQDAELVSFPGVVAGSVHIQTSDELWGVEGNFRLPVLCSCNYKVDFLAGFRMMELGENLSVTESLQTLTLPTTQFGVMDSFQTRNDFYGGQIGLNFEYTLGKWFIDATGKLAMGDMHEVASINGSTTITTAAGTTRISGGLLAQSSNIGRYSQDQFCLLPELGLKVGYNFTSHLRGFVGYDVLYASQVVRPGDQISTYVNPTYIPRNGPPSGVPAPSFTFHSTDFWAQGVSAGLEFRY